MDIDPSRLSAVEIYNILTATVVPRPIAWVSTVDGADRPNLAPFSFFNVAGVNPPVLCFSPLLDRAKDEKHTLANIREVGEFVVNIVNVDLVEHMNLTGAPYPAGVSEFAKAGLTPQPSKTIRPPSVGEALVSYECRLLQIIDLGATPLAGNLVLGLVCRIRVADDLFLDDKIDDRRLDAVARLAGCRYATMRDTFELPRATIEEE